MDQVVCIFAMKFWTWLTLVSRSKRVHPSFRFMLLCDLENWTKLLETVNIKVNTVPEMYNFINLKSSLHVVFYPWTYMYTPNPEIQTQKRDFFKFVVCYYSPDKSYVKHRHGLSKLTFSVPSCRIYLRSDYGLCRQPCIVLKGLF